MSLIALGINHKSAPIDVRERLSFADDESARLLNNLDNNVSNELAILSTCNRTEIYCNTESPEAVLNWLSHERDLKLSEISPFVYFHSDRDAVQHALRVASGLDSMVLGEPQILGQMKSAFTRAQQAGTIGTNLHRMFQYVFASSKKVRTTTELGAHPLSIAYAAVNLAKRIFSNIAKTQVMLVGAGETIELVAKYLQDAGVTQFVLANRTQSKADLLATKLGGQAIGFGALPNHLKDVDIIITATSSPLPIIGKGTLESALKSRRHRPMYIVDLAVPRDVEPEVGQLSEVFLYNIDDLQNTVQENLKNREAAATHAENIIQLQADHFMNWLRSLDAVSTIREFREQSDIIRQRELNSALQALKSGVNPEEVLLKLSNTLTNKLLHTPTKQIREAGYNGDIDMLAMVRALYDLNSKN